jgi:hypothetical protein
VYLFGDSEEIEISLGASGKFVDFVDEMRGTDAFDRRECGALAAPHRHKQRPQTRKTYRMPHTFLQFAASLIYATPPPDISSFSFIRHVFFCSFKWKPLLKKKSTAFVSIRADLKDLYPQGGNWHRSLIIKMPLPLNEISKTS